MKVATALPLDLPGVSPANTVELPFGLVGFPAHKRMELVCLPDQLPFLWMRVLGPTPLHFIVIEPGSIMNDYEPELFDEDAASIGLTDPADALVLNVVCVQPNHPGEATVNLVGPVVINRRTSVGKQVVLANHGRFSAYHPLLGGNAASSAARA
jgi:flagellar assembly factor FliW